MARSLAAVKSGLGRPLEEEVAETGQTAKVINRERFAALLTSGHSAEEAGLAVGVSPATAYRWAKDPEVRTLVKEWRTEVTDGLVRKLTRYGNAALDTVVEIMQGEGVSAQTRLTAAFGVLDRLGMSPAQLAQQGQEGTRVVIEQFLQLNLGDAAAEQQQRALGVHQARQEAIEGEYVVR